MKGRSWGRVYNGSSTGLLRGCAGGWGWQGNTQEWALADGNPRRGINPDTLAPYSKLWLGPTPPLPQAEEIKNPALSRLTRQGKKIKKNG